MPQVPWPRPEISPGLLALSLDLARCVRAKGGDTEVGRWPWDRVPTTFRNWLEGEGVHKELFLPPYEDAGPLEQAMTEWCQLQPMMKAVDKGARVERNVTVPIEADHLGSTEENADDTAHSESSQVAAQDSTRPEPGTGTGTGVFDEKEVDWGIRI